MVEHTVQNDRDAVPLRLVQQGVQRRLAAEALVHGEIIPRVVLVVGVGAENRAEVQNPHAQICQIVQRFRHAPQVAAEEGIIGKAVALPFGKGRDTVCPVRLHDGAARTGPVADCARAAPEPVHEHMVQHTLPEPFRHRVAPVVHQQTERLSAVRAQCEIHVVAAVREQSVLIAHQQEAVEEQSAPTPAGIQPAQRGGIQLQFADVLSLLVIRGQESEGHILWRLPVTIDAQHHRRDAQPPRATDPQGHDLPPRERTEAGQVLACPLSGSVFLEGDGGQRLRRILW